MNEFGIKYHGALNQLNRVLRNVGDPLIHLGNASSTFGVWERGKPFGARVQSNPDTGVWSNFDSLSSSDGTPLCSRLALVYHAEEVAIRVL